MAASTIRIHGNCDVNYMWGKSEDLTDENINSLKEMKLNTPEWDKKTVILANFTKGLSASDISKNIDSYIIHKQKIDDDVRYKVAEVDADTLNIRDYNINNESLYQYYVTPVYMENEKRYIGEPIPTNQVKTEFDYWCIMSLDVTDIDNVYKVPKDDVWLFYVNVDSGAFKPVFDKSVMDNMGQFPKIYVGKKDYLTGNLSCYIGNVDNYLEYQNDNISKIQKWREFCNNGKMKLLRDIKGHIIPCEITDTSYDVDDNLLAHPTTISFEFTQIADNKTISAYGTN